MFNVHRAASYLLLCLLSLFLNACSTSLIRQEIINIPNEKWRVTSLTVNKSDAGWEVSGQLRASNIFGLPEGYILLTITTENGQQLAQKKANYQSLYSHAGRPRKHQYGLALFAVHFDTIPENAKVIAQHIIEL